nr:7648_t:CDS:2 [Entrophospora candida]
MSIQECSGEDVTPFSPANAERTILSSRNEDVDYINQEILNMFPRNQHTYNSADNVVNEGVDNNNIYLMNSSIHLLSVEFHLQNLILRLVLLRNLTPKQGLCNGTRLAIINMTDNVIEARILCGDHAGELTFIP